MRWTVRETHSGLVCSITSAFKSQLGYTWETPFKTRKLAMEAIERLNFARSADTLELIDNTTDKVVFTDRRKK